MSCDRCGKAAENGHQGHHIGCPARRQSQADLFRDTGEKPDQETCAKDGCTNPRMVSKGPRPAKFCSGHKTTRRKS
ncbi:hypothetical protein [Streptomyces sp. MP131-18]|uniref:hypothetical protein n=1 Tax=Streptomyces sp. MP131-18 TaxID=1857892 RepID=UPI0009CFFF56|nr:hypothetical protein [Streptomyces sp. MP131-18]ONK10387.1 hypothetical protein STBA_11090 [Streptomyces sp. MP131-18]